MLNTRIDYFLISKFKLSNNSLRCITLLGSCLIVLISASCSLKPRNHENLASKCEAGQFKRIYYETKPLESKSSKNKNILVFFDGTGNNENTGTNIRRLFEYVCEEDQPKTTAIYIEGVGSLADRPITGLALGSKLEARTILGYDFIARNYNPGDSLYILGFSRGAMSARSLSGAISYAGIPISDKNNIKESRKQVHEIIELVKKTNRKSVFPAMERMEY